MATTFFKFSRKGPATRLHLMSTPAGVSTGVQTQTHKKNNDINNNNRALGLPVTAEIPTYVEYFSEEIKEKV